MSLNRIDYGLVYNILVGSEKPFTTTINDPDTGSGLDMSDTTTYATGVVKIIQPDGTILATVAITFTDRPNGTVTWTILDTTTVLANAGNWVGNLEISSDVPKIIEQVNFNFNIIESY